MTAFPAIEIADGLRVVESAPEECSALAWMRGFFDDACYFDSDGHVWSVSEAIPKRKLSWLDRTLNRPVPVHLELQLEAGRGMDWVKQRIDELLTSDPDDIFDQLLPHDEFRERVKQALSPEELLQVVRQAGL